VLFPHFVSFLHNKISNEENLQRCSIWDPAQKKLDEEKQKHAVLAQQYCTVSMAGKSVHQLFAAVERV
jgi:hypothetical protein